MKFGRIIHDLQEVVALNGNPFQVLEDIAKSQRKLFEAEREMYGDIITDIRYIMNAYLDYWRKEPLKFIKVNKKPAVEMSFDVLLTNEINVKGRVDGIVDWRGFTSLLEHKSHKDFPNDDHRWRNLQSVVYIRIMQMLGWGNAEGTLWDYIRSKPPTRPQLLKSGALSERSLDSLPEVVIDTIKEHKLNVKKYTGLIDTQKDNLGSWFMRVYTPVKTTVTNMVFREFIKTSREMADYYDRNGNNPPPRTMDRHCIWCPYESLCRAELQGNDVDFVREREYTIDTSEYQTEGEENEEAA